LRDLVNFTLGESSRPGLTEAALTLDDGTVYKGLLVGENAEAEGEVIFITAMSGYQEVLTDPSYHGQIVVFTTAHVGNYGTIPAVNQADRPQVAGVIFHELWLPEAEHWDSDLSLPSWLKAGGVTALTGVDTRALTLRLREKGARNGFIGPLSKGLDYAYERARAIPDMNGLDLAIRVSTRTPYQRLVPPDKRDLFGGDIRKVAVLDFGVKKAILDKLCSLGMDLTVWPGDTPSHRIWEEKPSGLFLANGPGDPAACDYAIKTTREFLGRVPVFGICLGHQIMGLAAGARTYKLLFGHHGLNHPVLLTDTKASMGGERAAGSGTHLMGKVLITSQNHGFAVDPDSLPKGVRANMWNLNDGTVEGLEWDEIPAFCAQFHPEASPGPHDATGLFLKFRNMIRDFHA
jgi:carbamoyl-phosphate synthase small subunit